VEEGTLHLRGIGRKPLVVKNPAGANSTKSLAGTRKSSTVGREVPRKAEVGASARHGRTGAITTQAFGNPTPSWEREARLAT
jgi:hypothetical protein